MIHFELKRGPREDDVDDVEWQATPLAHSESARLASRTLQDIREETVAGQPGLFLSLELICLQNQLTSCSKFIILRRHFGHHTIDRNGDKRLGVVHHIGSHHLRIPNVNL